MVKRVARIEPGLVRRPASTAKFRNRGALRSGGVHISCNHDEAFGRRHDRRGRQVIARLVVKQGIDVFDSFAILVVKRGNPVGRVIDRASVARATLGGLQGLDLGEGVDVGVAKKHMMVCTVGYVWEYKRVIKAGMALKAVGSKGTRAVLPFPGRFAFRFKPLDARDLLGAT